MTVPTRWTQTDELNLTADRTILKKLKERGEEPSAWLVAEYEELTARRKQAKPRRAKGEGGIYQRADGLWCVSLELPEGLDGKRRRKVICRRSKQAAVDELAKAKAELESNAAKEAAGLESLRAERIAGWRGTSRRLGL